MTTEEIFEHWIAQIIREQKTCEACRFLCFAIDDVCPRCGAYKFNIISAEDALKIPLSDIKLDLADFGE